MSNKVLQPDGTYCYTVNCKRHTPQQHLDNMDALEMKLAEIDMARDNELTKYPRTPHLPESEGMTSDDKMASAATLKNLASGIPLVVTEKMDGGNLTFTRSHFFGRSLDSGTHPWDTHAKSLWARVHHDIPPGWRVSGESMYARRSVAYDGLPDVYLVFGIWNDNNSLLSWEETKEWADLLGLVTVPEIYRGNDFEVARRAWGEKYNDETSEGFVVRNAGTFEYKDFGLNVAKRVRKDHVRTRADWRHRDDFAVNTFVSSEEK